MAKNKTTKANTDQPKRGRGRPASFPGQKTVPYLATIPTETREMIREIAEKRGQNINQALDQLIRTGHKAAMRTRKKSS
jgi:hypothetical protein